MTYAYIKTHSPGERVFITPDCMGLPEDMHKPYPCVVVGNKGEEGGGLYVVNGEGEEWMRLLDQLPHYWFPDGHARSHILACASELSSYVDVTEEL